MKPLSNINAELNVCITADECKKTSAKKKSCLDSILPSLEPDSEGSCEPFVGFSKGEKTRRKFIFIEMPTTETVPVQTSKRKRSAEKKPNDEHKPIKLKTMDDSIESESSKRPRRSSSKSKAEVSNQSKPRKVSKPRTSHSATKTNNEVMAQLSDLSNSSELEEIKQQLFNDPENSSRNSVYDDITDEHKSRETISAGTNDSTKEICFLESLLYVKQDQESIGNIEPYHRRKMPEKVEDETFNVVKLLDDWNESESEQTNDLRMPNKRDSFEQEVDDADSVITVTSETSDSSCAFTRELNFENKITPNVNIHSNTNN